MVRAGESVSLQCNCSSGDLPIQYQWLKDQRPLRFIANSRVFDNGENDLNNYHTTNDGFQSATVETEIAADSQVALNHVQTSPLYASHYRLRCQHPDCSSGPLQLLITSTSQSDSAMFTCSASNRHGQAQRQTRLLVQQPPETPGSLNAHPVSANSVQISWSRSFDGNSPLLHYRLQYRSVGSDNSWPAEETATSLADISDGIGMTLAPADAESISLNSLNASTMYEMRLAAVNRIGASSYTPVFLVSTLDEGK